MNIYTIGKPTDFQTLLNAYGVQRGGMAIMANKMETVLVHIGGLRTPAANILKQDALSIGADLAVPGGVITCEVDVVDALLIATPKQIAILAKKELAQPFGLKEVAQMLASLSPREEYSTRIMGVINANDDSFYASSRFVADDAVEEIERMIAEGAHIIDIGAVSSRPGSEPVDEAVELERIVPICDTIVERKLHEKVLFSIDSYTPAVVAYALRSGFGLVNDITGARDPELIKLAVEYEAEYCIMHMQGTPQVMQANPHYEDVTAEVDAFFAERIAACEAEGLPRERIILDPGIGFGKSLEHNLTLLRNLHTFTRHGCEVLIGASRKSMIDAITSTPVEARLPGTLAIHLSALQNGASIVRCHDVAEHTQAIKVWEQVGWGALSPTDAS
jgi:dihydropteroate synthase